jgi:xanthine dehydrogenase accessory factor
LDCQVTIFDTRAEWLDKLPEDPRLHRVLSADMPSEVAHLPEKSFVLVMTMGHSTDLPILREVLPRGFPYVGVIGSKAKASNLRRALLKEGIDEAAVNRFYSPMGLPIGTNHLQEIAISIAAQLIQVRDEPRD